MTTAPRILIFDSGVGGLTITESIQAQHPHCHITYASDTAAFPYGTKPEDELINRVDRVLHQLQTNSQADIIVVACNTASTVALPKIRQRFDIPIVGVVPAIKPAAQLSKSKIIGLLATPGTVSRRYTQELIDKFAQDCTVVALGSSELVLLAEDYLYDRIASHEALQASLSTILARFHDEPKLDTVVLACTHFPLLINEYKALLPDIRHWVDSGEAIARRVGYWLDELNLPAPAQFTPEHYCLFTVNAHGPHTDLEALAPALTKRGLGDMRFIKIEAD